MRLVIAGRQQQGARGDATNGANVAVPVRHEACVHVVAPLCRWRLYRAHPCSKTCGNGSSDRLRIADRAPACPAAIAVLVRKQA